MRNICAILVLLSFSPSVAFGFCGFYVGSGEQELYNDATNVILMRDGTSTILSMQNDYTGPLEDFAMIIPVPQVLEKSQVKTLSSKIFAKVDALAAPRLVEYWELNPCIEPQIRDFESLGVQGALLQAESAMSNQRSKAQVKIEAKFSG